MHVCRQWFPIPVITFNGSQRKIGLKSVKHRNDFYKLSGWIFENKYRNDSFEAGFFCAVSDF